MSPSRRSPRRLSLALERTQSSWEPETLLAAVQAAWAGVVGPMIAAESTPLREHGGVLTVGCSAAVWAQELELLGPTIVPRLNAVLKAGSLSRIRCMSTRG